MNIYDDFIKQIKEESQPPEGAFTVKMFTDDLGIGKDKARSLLAKQIENGRVKNVGRFSHPAGSGRSCDWFVVVESKPDL